VLRRARSGATPHLRFRRFFLVDQELLA
jgi:hypothetical protein